MPLICNKVAIFLYQILDHLNPVLSENSEKLEKVFRGTGWSDFPGVQALLMKGCTNQATADATWRLLARLTGFLRSKIIAPSRTPEEDGTPLFVFTTRDF